MNLLSAPYLEQRNQWPSGGTHILAHYNAETIIVYQAYRPSIGRHAIQHGVFGGEFSYSRMSWIKPNFLWMMYRSGWGMKEEQEVTLGLRLRRQFFDGILARAVASSFDQSGSGTHEAWKADIESSEVRLQWDPDHDPHGNAVARRAIQLGLRGSALEAFGKNELLDIIDMSAFVAEQRQHLMSTGLSQLSTPVERIYVPGEASIAERLKLD